MGMTGEQAYVLAKKLIEAGGGGSGTVDAYTKTQTDNLLFNKADKGTTLANYGITDGATKKEVSELKEDLGDYLYNINGEITDVTVRTRIVWVGEIEQPYLVFKDFNDNVNDKDIVIRFILSDNTERYENLRDNMRYDFGLDIVAYEIYVDPNHLSNPIVVNGVIYNGNGIFKELKKLNDSIVETNKNLNEKINLSYKWKMFTFDTYRENLIILGSNDGVNWETIGIDVFNGNEFGISLRDPSVIKINDTYYMIYSRITLREHNWEYPTGKYIGIAKSKDLLHWEGMNPIEFDGYHDMWAPEFYQKKDGTYGVILSCCQDGTDYHKIRTFDVTNFEPFTYSSLSEPQTSNILGSVFDLNMKNIKNSYIVTLSASTRIRFGKEIDGVLTYYEGNASWYNNDIEGSFLIEMDGFYRMYVADHTVVPNTISYTDSTDMINWSDLKQCNLPMTSLQHCSLIYEDEWINHKYNMLMN